MENRIEPEKGLLALPPNSRPLLAVDIIISTSHQVLRNEHEVIARVRRSGKIGNQVCGRITRQLEEGAGFL